MFQSYITKFILWNTKWDVGIMHELLYINVLYTYALYYKASDDSQPKFELLSATYLLKIHTLLFQTLGSVRFVNDFEISLLRSAKLNLFDKNTAKTATRWNIITIERNFDILYLLYCKMSFIPVTQSWILASLLQSSVSHDHRAHDLVLKKHLW